MRIEFAANVDGAVLRLDSVGRRMVDARPAFRTIARDLMAGERQRFDTEGFGRWPRLDPDTIRRKRRSGQSDRVLEASGRLRRALTSPGAPGQRLDIDRDQLRFGLQPNGAAYYGRFHQVGKGVPKRRVVGVTPRQRVKISGNLRDWILTGNAR